MSRGAAGAPRPPAPEGLLLIDKPRGVTSHDVVDVVRRALGTRKVGHAGTLDPLATGLLVVGVGRATRLLRFLSDLDKTYEGTARLGEETDTLDADGEIVATSDVSVTREAVVWAAEAIVGESRQTPPAYSAVLLLTVVCLRVRVPSFLRPPPMLEALLLLTVLLLTFRIPRL